MERDALVDYYSRRAAEYEKIYHKPERQVDLETLKTIARDFASGHDVLEIACGTGYWTEVIAPSARSVLATDASPEVLEMAKRKSYPGGRVRFGQADAFDPSAASGRFTAGFACFWWSHLPKDRIDLFLKRLHAKLDPEARVAFMDNRYVEGSSTPIARADGSGNTYQIRRLEDGSEQEVLKNFPSAAELKEAVGDLGANVAVAELTYYWYLSYAVASGGL